MGEGTHHQNSPVGKAVLAMGTKPQGKERRVPESQHGSSPATCAHGRSGMCWGPASTRSWACEVPHSVHLGLYC